MECISCCAERSSARPLLAKSHVLPRWTTISGSVSGWFRFWLCMRDTHMVFGPMLSAMRQASLRGRCKWDLCFAAGEWRSGALFRQTDTCYVCLRVSTVLCHITLLLVKRPDDDSAGRSAASYRRIFLSMRLSTIAEPLEHACSEGFNPHFSE